MDKDLSNVNAADEAKQRSIGERLRQERARLGLSQEQLAERAGVHRRTQANYELARSEPSTAYLSRIRVLGIDVKYVLEGDRSEELALQAMLDRPLLKGLLMALGYKSPDLVIRLAWDDWRSARVTPRFPFEEVEDPMTATAARIVRDSPFLRAQPGSSEEIDVGLLGDVFVAIDQATAGLPALPPGKLARLVAMIYRQSRASMKVDSTAVAELVKLAS